MKATFPFPRRLTRITAAVALVALTPAAFGGLVITPTFTTAFNSAFGANAPAAQASWIAAANEFSTYFNDNININITVDGVTGTSVFGQSQTSLNSLSYTTLRTRMVADSTTMDDTAALAGSISVGDPVGAAHTWWVSRAQAKAIGLIANDLSNDGTTRFGAGNPFTFAGPIAPGTYDFKGVALHEISEVMGRLGLSGGTIGGNANSYSLADLFSFTGPGARSLTGGAGSFFSIDGGVSLLKLYNNATLNNLDTMDWAPGSQGGDGSADAFNQFSNSGVVNGLSGVDLRNMDALGYNFITNNVPEPTSAALLAAGLALSGCIRRRKQ